MNRLVIGILIFCLAWIDVAAQSIPKNRVQRRNYYEQLAREKRLAGDYPGAIKAYEGLYDVVTGQNRERTLLNLTHLWLLTGDYQRVADSLSVKGRAQTPTALVNLSSALLRLQREQEAIALLDQAIAANTNDTITSIALQNKGYALWAMCQYPQARQAIEQSLSYDAMSQADRMVAQANLAVILSECKDFDQAIEAINAVIDWQLTNIGSHHPDYLISLRKKAEILTKMGRKDEAAKIFRQYFDGQKQRLNDDWATLSDEGRQNLWASQCRWLAQGYGLGMADPSLAFDIAIFSKSQHESNQYPDATAISKALKEKEILVDIVRYTDADTTRYGAIVCRCGATPKWLTLCNEDDILSSYVQGQKSYGTVKEAILNRNNNAKNRLYADSLLLERALGPVLDATSSDATIFLVPDGFYHLLAIEYLPSNRTLPTFKRLSSADGLVRRRTSNTISTSPMLLVGGIDYNDASEVNVSENPKREGCSMLAQYRMPPANGANLAILKGSEREVDTLSQIAVKSSPKKITGSKATKEALCQALPAAKIALISTHGYCLEPSVDAIPPHAVDSIIEDKSMLLSGLIAAGTNVVGRISAEAETHDDGILTAKELAALNLSNNQLIVLSACQTALGRINSDGTSGLIKALKRAGAGTLIASLWEVDDNATLALMTQFYQALLDGKSSPSQALAAAVSSLGEDIVEGPATVRTGGAHRHRTAKASPDYSLPYYRNAFIIIDDI